VTRIRHDRFRPGVARLLGVAGLLLALAGCQTPSAQTGANVVVPSLWLMISGGGAHTLGIKSLGAASGTLWSWGDNTYGQLGDGTNTSHFTPEQIGTLTDWVYVAAGQRHSIGVRNPSANTFTLWAWGDNTYGQLGTGTGAAPVLVPTQESTASSWGITGVGVVPGVPGLVAAGCYHTLALQGTGSVFAWGANDFGQLGDGTTTGRVQPTQMDAGNLYAQVAAGCTHSLGVRANGAVFAWGDNSQGQLGNGDATFASQSAPVAVTPAPSSGGLNGIAIGIAAGEDFSLAIYQNPPPSTNQLWVWGYNFYGQLGTGKTTAVNAPTMVTGATNWLRVAAGQNHSTGVQADGSAWVWGRNDVFQLGDGTTTNRLQPIQVLPNAGTILQMSAGSNHTLAGTKLAAVFDWGQNDKGQLGDGTTLSRSTPKALP